jgi:hypothetical protein
MGIDPDRFPTISTRRQAVHEADAHDRAGITAIDGAAGAAREGAAGAAGAAAAAGGLADGLGGPTRASTAAVSCLALADGLTRLAVALDDLGTRFGALADLARDEHLAHLRDRIGAVPADYIDDLLGPVPDHRAPGHADTCPGLAYHATHPTCPPADTLHLHAFDID